MHSISNYLNFIKEKGRPLSEINPGSDEITLAVNDALQAIELLKDNQTAILGGIFFQKTKMENWFMLFTFGGMITIT
ncbi:MAG: hypothetical protein R2774_16250 [Saprospiraceae bacterium]